MPAVPLYEASLSETSILGHQIAVKILSNNAWMLTGKVSTIVSGANEGDFPTPFILFLVFTPFWKWNYGHKFQEFWNYCFYLRALFFHSSAELFGLRYSQSKAAGERGNQIFLYYYYWLYFIPPILINIVACTAEIPNSGTRLK